MTENLPGSGLEQRLISAKEELTRVLKARGPQYNVTVIAADGDVNSLHLDSLFLDSNGNWNRGVTPKVTEEALPVKPEGVLVTYAVIADPQAVALRKTPPLNGEDPQAYHERWTTIVRRYVEENRERLSESLIDTLEVKAKQLMAINDINNWVGHLNS